MDDLEVSASHAPKDRAVIVINRLKFEKHKPTMSKCTTIGRVLADAVSHLTIAWFVGAECGWNW